MFEVKSYIGTYRQSGFVAYQDAVKHAQEKADEDGKLYVVNEIVLRCTIRPKPKK